MSKNRLEAFSDGVMAIILTIMVLEMKVPRGDPLEALRPLWGVFSSYVLSFVFVGIYWNNHHHVFQAARTVSAGVLWANLHLLFWLSLVPFVTGWMGGNFFAAWPTAVYGFVMLMGGVAYNLMVRAIVAAEGKHSVVARAVGADAKGTASVVLLAGGVAVALWMPWLAGVAYGLVAAIWLVPDRRIERAFGEREGGQAPRH